MFKKRIVFFIVFCLFLMSFVSALRISPAKINIPFKPGLEMDIGFTVSSTLDRELEIYAAGDLTEYVIFDPQSLFKEGEFKAILKLPEEIDPPGTKKIRIGVKEILDEELVKGLATTVAIESAIYVSVPYPGKYVEIGFQGHNVNIGEPITFELTLNSRGKEAVTAIPVIEVYDEDNNLLDSMEMMERELQGGEVLELKKILDTTSYGSGDYYAIAKVDYGGTGIAEKRVDFKIGELNIEIVNHTKKVVLGGLRPFYIMVESGWNDYIDGAFADITFYNKTKTFETFRTTPANLEPWQTYILKGYLDTEGFVPGMYNATVLVTYYGRDKGKTKTKIIETEFVEPEEKQSYWPMILIIAGSAIGLVILLIIIVLIIKHGKKK